MTLDMDQGIFVKRNIKCGDLIVSERPLRVIAPTWFGRDTTDGQYTSNQVRQVMMFEYEKVLEIAVKRMPEKERVLSMALHNSHIADGTSPLLGIIRTNALGVSEIDAWMKHPEWTGDILPSALLLEEAMVAEGLDFVRASFSPF